MGGFLNSNEIFFEEWKGASKGRQKHSDGDSNSELENSKQHVYLEKRF
ncbi:MAG: hypothetical protein ACRD8W_15690 [Nitrososphaeraceae archaeon]